MTLKERFKAKETRVGQILKKWVTGVLLFCAALGAANDYLIHLPSDFVPAWLKPVIVISGVISFVAGKLTVAKQDPPAQA